MLQPCVSQDTKYERGFVQFTTQQGTKLLIRPDSIAALSEVKANPNSTGSSAKTQIDLTRCVFWVMEDINTVIEMITGLPTLDEREVILNNAINAVEQALQDQLGYPKEVITERDNALGDSEYWMGRFDELVKAVTPMEETMQNVCTWFENWMTDDCYEQGGKDALRAAQAALQAYRAQKE